MSCSALTLGSSNQAFWLWIRLHTVSQARLVQARPFGPSSHAPLEDGSQPEGFPIKGNEDSMLYHVPGSSFYARTVAEVWFKTAYAAEQAGFQLPPSQRGDADRGQAGEAGASGTDADATSEEEGQ